MADYDTDTAPHRGRPTIDLRLQRHRRAPAAHVALRGELDLVSAPHAEQQLLDAAATNPGLVVVDLSELTFMDCTGLAVLLRAQHAAEINGHRLTLAQVPRQVRRLLDLAELDDRFTIED